MFNDIGDIRNVSNLRKVCNTHNAVNFSNIGKIKLREKCPYLEFFWSIFSRILTEYGRILRISLNSVCMRGNTDQKNSEYGHFSRSVSSEEILRSENKISD